MKDTYKRDPEAMLIKAQLFLLLQRAKLPDKDINEWLSMSEAVLLMDKCIKLIKDGDE